MTTTELDAEVNRICARLLQVPKSKRKAQLTAELNKLPEVERTTALQLVAVAVELTDNESNMKKLDTPILVFGGAVFLVVMLVIALFVPNPTQFQLLTFRIVLALAAAAAGCALPGFLNIESKIKLLSLRAGGALALFCLIYFYNPAKLIQENKPEAGGKGKEKPIVTELATNVVNQ